MGMLHIIGANPDSDIAWDLAMDNANDTIARNDLPLGVDITEDTQTLTVAQAVRRARTIATGGQVVAVAYTAPRVFTRRRARVVLVDPCFTLPTLGVVVDLDGEVIDALVDDVNTQLAVDGGSERVTADTVDDVELLRRIVRGKVAAIRHTPPTVKTYALVRGDHIVARFPTQSEARGYALNVLRTSEQDADRLDLVAVTARHDGPLVHIERSPKSVRGVFKVSFAQPKTENAAIMGWVFAWDDSHPTAARANDQ